MAAREHEETFKVTDRRRRSSEDDAPPARTAEPPREAAAPPPTFPDDGESLSPLFSMLANSAAMALGEGDAAQAGELIETLVLLRKRTEGNRTAEESQVLDELIYEVQVRYVEVMKRSG
jgi:hypothetical protein